MMISNKKHPIVADLGSDRMTESHPLFGKHDYRNVAGIERIVKEGLCHRCGACVGFCPVGTYETDEFAYPKAVNECINCNVCVDVCSGLSVNYPELGDRMFGDDYSFGKSMEIVRTAYIAGATDAKVRQRGASGGVITQLMIHWLKTGRIKGGIVVIEDPDNPGKGKGIVARSPEEFIAAAQSRYTSSPSLAALQEIQNEDGPFALVGLPCQIHSLRKRQMRDPQWRERIPITIALFCHYNLSCEASSLAARVLTPSGRTLKHVNYRERDEKGWPHNTLQLQFDDGSKWRSPYGPAQVFNIVSRVSSLGRCLSCLDAMGDFADLSVGDPWIRDDKGNWKYHDSDGTSAILSRTDMGEELMQEAKDAGALTVKKIPIHEVFDGQHAMILEKQERVALRIRVKKFFKIPTPRYPMALPKTSWGQMKKEIAFVTTRIIPMIPVLPSLLFRFGFSRYGAYFINRRIKKRKKLAASGKAKYSTSDFGTTREK